MTMRVFPGPDSIWGLALPAIVWSAHFLWCYVVNAVLCAAGLGADTFLGLAAIQWNIIVATAVLGAILLASLVTAAGRLRSPELGEQDPDMSDNSLAAQRLFLARSTLAIAAVSLLAMGYVAMPALFFATCR